MLLIANFTKYVIILKPFQLLQVKGHRLTFSYATVCLLLWKSNIVGMWVVAIFALISYQHE